MTKKYKLVIPEKIEKKYASIAAMYEQEDVNGSIRNNWPTSIPESWLIPIEDKKCITAEEYYKSCINDHSNVPDYVKTITINSFNDGAKNERVKFEPLVQIVKNFLAILPETNDIFISQLKEFFEKINN